MTYLKNSLIVCLLISCQVCVAQLKKGLPAPAIVLANAQDSLVSLASFKGKVVLLDFWASWCGPCRMSNPGLVKLYKAYQNKGLEIVGVSLDENKKAWLQAIKQDGLNYTLLIDPSGSSSQVANTYGIQVIPTSFLIDKQGRLQEKDLHGNALEKKLKELLNE